MIEWMKPNGTTITTNSEKATVEYAESLGWKRVVVKRKRRTKEQMAAARGE